MKKAILFGGLLLGMAAQANAQLAKETFNSGLPATWSMIKVDNNTPSSGLNAKIVTAMSSQAWMTWTRGTNDTSVLTISMFTPAGTADRWLISPAFTVNDPKMILSWLDAEGISGKTDNLQIWVSPTAGTTTSSFTTKVYDAATLYGTTSSGAYIYTQRGASLGQFNGQNIRIAFRNNTNNQGVSLIDDVGTAVMPNAVDGAVDGVTFPKIIEGTVSNAVKVVISNQGATPITSAQVSYAVDAGTPVTQTFSSLSIAPYGTATLTFTTPITGTTTVAHTLKATLIQVNGAADPVASNNTKQVDFATATGKVPRAGLIEEFSSSTCAPCASFNSTFDPLVNTNNPNNGTTPFNILKYQMNWPAPGNDQSYNNQGLTRRTYYGVTGIPDHFTNGAAGGNGDQAEITASKNASAFITISKMTYVVKGDSMIASATLTPNFTLTVTSGPSYKVHMAALESNYQNPNNTTGQLQYYHVMRDMLGGGAGQTISSFTAGTPINLRWAHKYIVGSVAQMNSNYWVHPINGELVVFVQDESDKSILQSAGTKASWPLGVTPLNETISQAVVFPNPATDHTSISFKLEAAASVDMQVVDALGRVVYSVAPQKLTPGTQTFEIATSNLARGLYTIKVNANGATINERFSVN